MEPCFRPTCSPERAQTNLHSLITGSAIRNDGLDRLITRLNKRFSIYLARYPFGLWSTGLAVDSEMRGLTEQYLPMAEIRTAFRKFLSLALRFPPTVENDPFRQSVCWLDVLQRFHLPDSAVNPAAFLGMLTENETLRIRFLFTLLVPSRHGESFARYPAQISFLKTWLSRKTHFLAPRMRCLDAACGTGESSYDLARLISRYCNASGPFEVHGCSLEPLEVFSAAHCCFPHDPDREHRFRTAVKSLFVMRATESMLFFRDNILRYPDAAEAPYDIILCNGLLGGPFLHESKLLADAIASLTQRLAPGGVLLAADHFHDGWKKICPPSLIGKIMQSNGLEVLYAREGLIAKKE